MDIDFLILTSIIAIGVTTILVSVLYLLRMQIKQTRDSHYDLEKSQASLDAMREKLEGDIYRINRELTLSEARWKEMNHLLLSAQKDVESQSAKTAPPRISRFLSDMGISEADIKIDKKLVFVLTPFHESQIGIFHAIVSTCNRYGFRCVRGDEEFVRGDIFPVLLKYMVEARLIIANIEGRNPNVFYELGIAHAMDKPVILVAKSISDMPFDIKSRSIVLFTDENDLREKLSEALLRATLAEDNERTRTLRPTMVDLEKAITSSKDSVRPLYSDYLQDVIRQLEATKPEFEKFPEYDDAIVSQINKGSPVSYSFVETAMLASRYDNFEAIEVLYSWFGKSLGLCDIPSGFSGTYKTTDFDGFRFLVYEMFVAFIACLMKYDRWESIGKILGNDIFLEEGRKPGYVPFVRISEYLPSLDEIRNKRLNLNRRSVMADMLKDRFSTGDLSSLLQHHQFMEADYLLFVRSVCHANDLEVLANVWCPRSCIYLRDPPLYIVKSESKKFLQRLASAMGFNDSDDFANRFKARHSSFRRFFGVFQDDPLSFYDLGKIGTRQ